jgi:hypothetical protein
MEKNLRVNGFLERPFSYNTELQLTPDILQEIDVKLAIAFKYQTDTNYVGVEMNIQYAHNSNEILAYSTLLTLFDPNWLDFVKTVPTEEDIRMQMLPHLKYALDFTRGALAIRSKGTVVEELYLPHFEMGELKDYVLLELIKNSGN